MSRATEVAYRILAFRSRSEEELREKLRQKGFREDAVEQAVSSLKEKGYLNDLEFSLSFARHLLRTRHCGLIRIAQELRKKGISAEIIRNTIKSLKTEIDEKEVVTKALEARIRKSNHTQMDEKEKKRIIQHLSRKGFQIDTIYEVLKKRKWKVIEDDRE